MFVHDYVEVDAPFEEVADALESLGGEVGLMAKAAYERGERLALGPGGAFVSAPVEFEVGKPLISEDGLSIPIAWTGASGSKLFPRMEAELVATRMGSAATHILFRGRYSPPLDVIGEALDRVLLHRIAEATVSTFITRLGRALETEVGAGSR